MDRPAGGVNNGNAGITAAPGHTGTAGVGGVDFRADVVIPLSVFYGYPIGIDVYQIDIYHIFFLLLYKIFTADINTYIIFVVGKILVSRIL